MKVLCKKDYIVNDKEPQLNLYQDHFYEIYIEFRDSYWIYNANMQSVYKFYKSKYYSLFDDYFITLNESRKKKLKKLYKNK